MDSTVIERIEIVNRGVVFEELDAIVNAANERLLGGGGVDGAIHKAAGPALTEECRGIGGCPTGQARITRGYRLPASYVIHTVGPVYRDGQHGEEELLTSCYRHCLLLAVEHGIRKIAFPCISTGVYGYPLDKATEIALRTTAGILEQYPQITLVRFCCFTRMEFDRYVEIERKCFRVSSGNE